MRNLKTASEKDFNVISYCNDVLEGRIIAGELQRLACKRHLDDLKNSGERGFYFNENIGARVVKFFNFLKHYKGEMAGQKFELEDWQKFIIYMLFGWLRKKDNGRRFRYAYVEVARKNGKTMLAGGLGIYMLDADNEPSAEVYSTATKKDQARICFDASRYMVQNSQLLKKHIGIYNHNLHVISTASKYEPLSKDVSTLDGINPHFAIIDEFHAHKSDALFNIIKSGMGARKQPMVFIITTAGFDLNSPCYKFRENVKKVLYGINEDDTLFGVIYTLDKEDNWEDKKNWVKANPSLAVGNAVKLDYLESEYKQAKNNPEQFRVPFLTKNLNIWVNAQEAWITDEVWMSCKKEMKLSDYKGRECYAAIDLGAVSDITCVGLLFENKDETLDYFLFSFVPEAKVWDVYNHLGINYPEWVREGYLIATPGNVTDYDFIEEKVKEISESYNIKLLAYDRWNASQTIIHIQDFGVKVNPYGQGFASMSNPTKEIEKLVSIKKLRHDGNPVLRWMLSNVSLEINAAGDRKMSKRKSSGKIDGMITLAMCLGEYLTDKNEASTKKSIYEEQGLRVV